MARDTTITHVRVTPIAFRDGPLLNAAAAIVLTLVRPGLRAYAHVRNRLSLIGNELQVPREVAQDLRR